MTFSGRGGHAVINRPLSARRSRSAKRRKKGEREHCQLSEAAPRDTKAEKRFRGALSVCFRGAMDCPGQDAWFGGGEYLGKKKGRQKRGGIDNVLGEERRG